MGTEAMKYSLVSREVIADSIELMTEGYRVDGVIRSCEVSADDSVFKGDF